MIDGKYIERLTTLLSRYRAHITEYRVERDTIEMGGVYCNRSYNMPKFNMHIEFSDVREARLFIDVLIEMEEEFTREEAIRNKHPKLQEIYEEYKILLRLYE